MSEPSSPSSPHSDPSSPHSDSITPEQAPAVPLTAQEAQAIRDRLDEAAARAARAAERSGRAASDVRLMLATKTQPPERIRVALEHGFTMLGENRVQELTGKAEALADIAHEAHLIGPLQRNKVNHVLRVADCIQSIDSLALAERVQRRLELEDQRIDVFVQVNTSREDTKSGAEPAAAPELLAAVQGLDRLRLRGLMTIGLPGSTADAIRPSYAELRALRDSCLEQGIIDESMCELSMGMSADFELAIEEGATMVRLGSSIFGARTAG